jgi:hypothetical protein
LCHIVNNKKIFYFILYNWDIKNQVQELGDFLKSLNYEVWVYTSSSLPELASAIKLFLIITVGLSILKSERTVNVIFENVSDRPTFLAVSSPFLNVFGHEKAQNAQETFTNLYINSERL